jgi:hypothetical protein
MKGVVRARNDQISTKCGRRGLRVLTKMKETKENFVVDIINDDA